MPDTSLDDPQTRLDDKQLDAPLNDAGRFEPALNADSLYPQVIELRKQGLSFSAIGKQLNLPKSTVAHVVNKYVKSMAKSLGKEVSTVNREDIQRKIFELAPKMLEKVATLASGAKKEEVQLKASTDLLDRAGFNPVQKSIQLSIVEEMPRDELIQSIRAILNPNTNPDATPITPPNDPLTPNSNMGSPS